MGLFCEMLDKERIKNSFTNSSNVLMVTCPGCACESLSYTEGLPCRAIEQGKDMEHSAIAVHVVRDKWDEILKQMELNVKHISVAFPCEMFDTDRELIIDKSEGIDTVAVLGCSSALIAIRDMLLDFKVTIVPMMKTSGTFVFKLIPDETGQYSKVDQKTARVIRLSELSQMDK